jgi:hypothetical protein
MARIPVDPNYSFPTFPRATAATDIFVKEDVQALAAAVSTHVHDGAGKGLLVGGPAAGSITNAMLGADVARDNLLVNGSMAVAQRGGGPFTTSNAYTADRWLTGIGAGCTLSVTAGAVSGAIAAIGPGGANVNCLAGSHTSGGNSSYILQQLKFAGDGNAGLLRGQNASLSMRVYTGTANAVRLQLQTDGTAPLVATSSFCPGDSAPHTLTVTGFVPIDATFINVFLQFTASAPSWYAGQAMLVVGSQAANYVPMHPADDLARCKRYYDQYGGSFSADIYVAATPTAGTQGMGITLPTRQQMPVMPTVTKVGTWAVTNSSQPAVTPGLSTFVVTGTSIAAGIMVFNTLNATTYVTLEANP